MIDFTLIDKEAKTFTTRLFNINQLMKGMRYDSSYTIYNGMCFASPNGNNKPNAKGGFDKVDIGHTYCNLTVNLDELNSHILYIQNGKALYQFIRDFKKYINKVTVSYYQNQSYLELYTENEGLFRIEISTINEDIDRYNSLLEILNKETRYPTADYIYNLSPIDIADIYRDKAIPVLLDVNGYKIKVTKKMLLGMTIKDDIELSIYPTNNTWYFIALFSIRRKEMIIYHMYKCIKY